MARYYSDCRGFDYRQTVKFFHCLRSEIAAGRKQKALQKQGLASMQRRLFDVLDLLIE
jgi:hypothetical protein